MEHDVVGSTADASIFTVEEKAKQDISGTEKYQVSETLKSCILSVHRLSLCLTKH
jgi:hypothetical protein